VVLRPDATAGHGEPRDVQPVVTPEIAAEAAVWVARLHGPDRTGRMERECLAWQAQSAAHRLAFERCTDTWQDVPGVTLAAYATAAGRSGVERGTRPQKRLRWSLGLGLVTLMAGGLAVLQPWRDIDTYATGVGEQQIVVLRDGTRMSLNTATRARVEFASARRTVHIVGGEALFEVAKDVHRPFVVRAAGSEVVALGTVFSVRLAPNGTRVDDALAVTLIEGLVTVRAATEGPQNGAAPARPLLLHPGDRIRLNGVGDSSSKGAERAVMDLDRPRIEQVTAWTRSEAVFDDTPLPDAVAEMNRYSRVPIVLGDPSLSSRRISGLFRTGDPAGFARALAALHGLVVHEHPDRLELTSR